MTAGNVNGRDIHQRFRETLQSVSADPTKVKVVLASRITRGGIVSSQDSPTKRKERVEAARAIKGMHTRRYLSCIVLFIVLPCTILLPSFFFLSLSLFFKQRQG